MKHYPLITIAIPTYNRANGYLKDALASALGQTYPNVEIVVSDNCSTDNTRQVVAAFANPRIRYFQHPVNIGANNNFNFCLKQARGAYFLLFHDDDLIDEDFIEACVRAAGYRTDFGIIRTGTRIIDTKGNVIREKENMVGGFTTDKFFLGWFAGKTSLFLCSTLFNTDKLRQIGGFRSRHNLFQDVFAEVQLAARYGRVDIPEVKASFRKHPAEMTFSAKVSAWSEDSLILLDLMCALASDESREMIRKEGLNFFSAVNYNRAGEVESFPVRLFSYLQVVRLFNFRRFPNRRQLAHLFLGKRGRSVGHKVMNKNSVIPDSHQ